MDDPRHAGVVKLVLYPATRAAWYEACQFRLEPNRWQSVYIHVLVLVPTPVRKLSRVQGVFLNGRDVLLKHSNAREMCVWMNVGETPPPPSLDRVG